MPLGLYISVPFCRTKCSYCNFASDVFSSAIFQRYIDRVCADISRAAETAEHIGGVFDRAADSVYLGGGTPTVLDIAELERLFVTISQNFDVQPEAEITVECAPGTLTPALLDLLRRCDVNRVSLGAQSFIDQESRSVGRLHTRTTVIDDIARLRGAGIENINIDLIAGLPHQTLESWNLSLSHVIDSGVPHVSVYMLEVDEDSRLGRELIAGGTRYHAYFVPDEDVTADLYETGCERLDNAGVHQYEISNFARTGHESRHNLKYWTRQPYLGFGVDAHSMLAAKAGIEAENQERRSLTRCEQTPVASMAGKGTSSLVPPSPFPLSFREGFSPRGICFSVFPCGPLEAVRFATPDSLDKFLAGAPPQRTPVSPANSLEESFFLGLRLNRGVDLSRLAASFGEEALGAFSPAITECMEQNLLERDDEKIRLTSRGRLLSNEVFARFLAPTECIG
jgi:putative oxygen-independent coproporphyrinogen III oxidase